MMDPARTDLRRSKTRAFAGWLGVAAWGLLGLIPLAQGQVGSFDSGSDGSDGALFIKGTLPVMDEFGYAYDAGRGEVVAFGGDRWDSFSDLDHTYVFDGTSWLRKAREMGPSGRLLPAMAYDAARQQVTLFGGDAGENDTWIWDGEGWTEVATNTSPPASYSGVQAMAYDAARQRVTLVLRENFSDQEMQTWTFDGADWTQQAARLPNRRQPSMVYDPALERLVLVARAEEGSGFATWLFDGAQWSELADERLPFSFIDNGALVYDGNLGAIAYYGNDEAYRFDGSSWSLIEDVPPEFAEGMREGVYYPELNALLRMNGSIRVGAGVRQVNETWAWRADGSVEQLTSGSYRFDMRGRPDGIWQFTDIYVGPNVEVTFERNAANTPVRWLASGDVVIDGIVNLSSTEREEPNLSRGDRALGGFGGPGGFDGASSSPLGWEFWVPGNGPGGGYGLGSENQRDAEFSSYGNAWLRPLVGGSGGGTLSDRVVGGGGGGGAILIAASGDLTLNGQVSSIAGRHGGSSVRSDGSGGSVLLQANRALGEGDIYVDNGWRRVEAWERPLVDSLSGFFRTRESGLPLLPVDRGAGVGRLWIDSIAGQTVTNPPLSHDSVTEPDVVVPGSGSVEVVVRGENIPAGTLVDLFVRLQDDSVLELSPQTYDGQQAVFQIEVPEGVGAMTAEARFPY